jgi:CheY-like chemotaxis protein
VSTARNAEEALAVAERVRPQIVLCDIGLPGMDGFHLVEPLRARLRGAPVVFAAVTGYASGDDQQRALDAGFDSFFVKPLNPGSLANLLRSYAARPA